jgi:Fe-S oxidoreductase
MAYALRIPCVTAHFFPQTAENMLKLCRLAGIEARLPESATCCGLPYFEKGELKTAKSIGEYNLTVAGNDDQVCLDVKCKHTFEFHYPKIFNNTVSHNATLQMVKQIKGIDFILDKLNIDKIKNIQGNYFFIKECCQTGNGFDYIHTMTKVNWQLPFMRLTCCGAGSSMPHADKSLSDKMALALIDEFTASGASAMVFEDDICRKHVENVASSRQITIQTFHIIDIIANAL